MEIYIICFAHTRTTCLFTLFTFSLQLTLIIKCKNPQTTNPTSALLMSSKDTPKTDMIWHLIWRWWSDIYSEINPFVSCNTQFTTAGSSVLSEQLSHNQERSSQQQCWGASLLLSPIVGPILDSLQKFGLSNSGIFCDFLLPNLLPHHSKHSALNKLGATSEWVMERMRKQRLLELSIFERTLHWTMLEEPPQAGLHAESPGRF